MPLRPRCHALQFLRLGYSLFGAFSHSATSTSRSAARVRLFSQRSICRRACAEPLSAARRFAKRFWIRSALAFAFLTAMRAWLNSVRARPAGVWSNLRERSRLCERRVSGDRLRAAIEGDDEPAGRRAVHIALDPTLAVGSDPVEIGMPRKNATVRAPSSRAAQWASMQLPGSRGSAPSASIGSG